MTTALQVNPTKPDRPLVIRIETAKTTYANALMKRTRRNIAAVSSTTQSNPKQVHESGRHASLLQLVYHPPLAFLRNYMLRGGLRDGAVGFVISALNSYYVFLKFAKLWEIEHATPVNHQVTHEETFDRRAR